MYCTSLLAAHLSATPASANANRAALAFIDQQGDVRHYSWRTLIDEVAAAARSIDRQGFVPGDRLVHAFGNTNRGVVIAIASMIIGTIEVPLDPSANSDSHQSQCKFVDGRWFHWPTSDLRTHPSDSIHWLSLREQQLKPDHPVIILFTSGSTGDPKGVMLSRNNLFTNASAKLFAAPQSIADVRLTVLPLWHAYARTCDLMTWLLSSCTLAISQGWEGWQNLSPIVQPSLINTVPSFAERLLSQAADHSGASNLRLLGCGGAAMTTDLFACFADRCVTVIQGYGLTEASPVVCSATPTNSRPGLVGKPITGCETRIGADGQLYVRGDGVMLGYWNDPCATREKINDGWLETGDCVEVDPDHKQYRIVGRMDDRITLSSGLKFFPGQIEQLVAGLTGISHAILIPDDRHVDLFIDVADVIRPSAEYISDVRLTLAAFPAWQQPRHIYVLHRLFSGNRHATTSKGNLCRPLAIEICKAASANRGLNDRRR